MIFTESVRERAAAARLGRQLPSSAAAHRALPGAGGGGACRGKPGAEGTGGGGGGGGSAERPEGRGARRGLSGLPAFRGAPPPAPLTGTFRRDPAGAAPDRPHAGGGGNRDRGGGCGTTGPAAGGRCGTGPGDEGCPTCAGSRCRGYAERMRAFHSS